MKKIIAIVTSIVLALIAIFTFATPASASTTYTHKYKIYGTYYGDNNVELYIWVQYKISNDRTVDWYGLTQACSNYAGNIMGWLHNNSGDVSGTGYGLQGPPPCSNPQVLDTDNRNFTASSNPGWSQYWRPAGTPESQPSCNYFVRFNDGWIIRWDPTPSWCHVQQIY